MSVRTRQFLLYSAMIVVLALCLRLPWLYNALEYDELWSLQNYAPLSIGQILTDLGLPNNHPLNSLWLKIVAGWDSRVLLRFHSLLAGLGTVIAGGWFSLYYFRSRRAALGAMLCLAISMPLAAYSQAARGYSLQTFFITLFALSAVALQPRFRGKGWLSYLPVCGIVFSGVCAIWSLSSSALFLFPIALAAVWQLFLRWKKGEKDRAGVAALAVFGIFTLIWYGSLWQVMRGAQGWADPVTGVGMYAAWIWKTFMELGFPVVLFLLLALYRKNRLIAFAVFLPVLMEAGTNLAGTRVHLPLVPGLAAMTGYAASRFRRWGWILLAVFAMGSFSQRAFWTATDWYKLFDEAKSLPENHLVLYSATSGYPLAENNGNPAMIDFVRRLQYSGKDCTLVLVGSSVLNGVDAQGREQEIVPVTGQPFRLGGENAWRVKVSRCDRAPAKGDYLLAVVPPVRPEIAIGLMRQMSKCGPGWQLNRWLTRDIFQNGRPFLYRLALFRVENPEKLDSALLKIPPQILTLYHIPGK
ncbi:MAG: hypothetical protein IJC34_00060 [Lentisphaeria bacterium]|nr:hypothetical protein [Lentisphaeria bacterium]